MNIDADGCFFGDSITRWTNFQEHFPEKQIVNMVLSGDSLAGIQREETVKAIGPKVVFIEGGINRFSNRTTLGEYQQVLNSLLLNVPESTI